MKKTTKIIWGIILIAAGVLFSLDALGILTFQLFFDGWWTLFIIIPCVISLFTERDKTGSLIGIAIGVFLLLCAQGVLAYDMLWKLLLPIAVIIIGLKMLFSALSKKSR